METERKLFSMVNSMQRLQTFRTEKITALPIASLHISNEMALRINVLVILI